MKTWIKGGLWGLLAFFIFSVLLVYTPFAGKDYQSGYQILLLPYLFIIFILGGIIIGLIVGKNKNSKTRSSKNLKGAKK